MSVPKHNKNRYGLYEKDQYALYMTGTLEGVDIERFVLCQSEKEAYRIYCGWYALSFQKKFQSRIVYPSYKAYYTKIQDVRGRHGGSMYPRMTPEYHMIYGPETELYMFMDIFT